jgi:uncharacterized protein YdhG (YjbR/CyaY superfamily)
MATKYATVDEYIDAFPAEVRERLERIRQIVRDVVPESGERISYGIPTATVDGRSVVHYSAWKRHLSIYPEPEGDAALTDDLAPHRAGRGTLQFRLDQPLPDALLRRIVTVLATRRQPAG